MGGFDFDVYIVYFHDRISALLTTLQSWRGMEHTQGRLRITMLARQIPQNPH